MQTVIKIRRTTTGIKKAAGIGTLLLFVGGSMGLAQSVTATNPVVRCLAFSPDGSRLAVAGSNQQPNGKLLVWDTATWKVQWSHTEPVGFPRLAFSPDGARVALSRFAPETKILDSASGEVAAELEGHTNHARCVTYTPDGGQIITGSSDKTIIVWDARTNQPLAKLEGHTAAVYHVAVSADATLLASAGSRGGQVHLWDLHKRKRIHRFEQLGSHVPHVAFSQDGFLAVSSWTESLTLFDSHSFKASERIDGIGGIHWTAFSPNGKWLAVASNGPILRLFDIDATRDQQLAKRITSLLNDFKHESYEKRELASRELSEIGWPAKKQVLEALQSPEAETRIRARKFLRGLVDARSADGLQGHQADLKTVAFSPDGALLASGDEAGKVIVWSMADRSVVARLSLDH